jgi:transketolase
LIVDNNHLQKMDSIRNIMGLDDLGGQIEKFGWQVKHADGHDVGNMRTNLLGEWKPERPRCVVADTVKGKGVSLMENNPSWHWRMPNKKELNAFCAELGISGDELAAIKRRQ